MLTTHLVLRRPIPTKQRDNAPGTSMPQYREPNLGRQPRELGKPNLNFDVPAVEENMREVGPADLLDDRATDDVTRRQVRQGVVVRHEPVAVAIDADTWR